jgi:hypothetical protein
MRRAVLFNVHLKTRLDFDYPTAPFNLASACLIFADVLLVHPRTGEARMRELLDLIASGAAQVISQVVRNGTRSEHIPLLAAAQSCLDSCRDIAAHYPAAPNKGVQLPRASRM